MRSFVSLVKNNSDDPVMEIALPTLLGITTGLLLGLTGAGGGIVAAPLLMLVLHQSVTAAAPISLLSITMGALVGTLMGLRSGQVRYRAALHLSAAGLLFQPLGIYASHVIPNTPLLLFFAAVLGYLGLRYWRGKTIARDKDPACAISPTNKRFIWNKPCLWVMTRTGLLAGFLSGLLGLGGGFVLIPALRRHTTLPMQAVSATSLMVLTIVSAGGVLQWMAAGEMNWHIAAPFSWGAILGMVLGRMAMTRIPEARVHLIFGGLCLMVGAALVVKAFASL